MTKRNVIGFTAYETVMFSMTNLNFGPHSPAEADALVRAGKGRWAWLHGNTLGFVENDYELKVAEHFLTRRADGHFEVIE